MEAFNQRLAYRLSPRALHIFEELARQTDPGTFPSLVGNIAVLSNLFTRERTRISARYLDDSALGAGYAAYFLPVNFAKVQLLLRELPDDWAGGTTLSVLDIGSGPGTASLAVLDQLVGQSRLESLTLHVAAVDHSKPALMEATRLWNAYVQDAGGGRAELVTSVEQIEKLAKMELGKSIRARAPYDLIIVANCLNEFFQGSSDPDAHRAMLLERLLSVLKPDGTLMVLEPALRSTARALHKTRDLLLAQGLCTVYSPCLHDLGCPALAKITDWCHEERPWDPPWWIDSLDRELGFIKDALKFSYLLLRKDGRTIVPRRTDVYRVVSELRVFKGEKRAWLCNELGRSEVGRLDRKATAANAALDHWHRGVLVHIEGVVRKDRGGRPSDLGRIVEDSAVEIVREA